MQQLTLRLLGRPEVLLDGRPAKFPTRKALALLVYLVVTGEVHTREKLLGLLWPDTATSAAQASLRNTLARLRLALGEAGVLIIATPDAIGIDPRAQVELDLRAVSAAVASIHDTTHMPPLALLHAAVTTYRDEFLSEFDLIDAPDFDRWAMMQRERWHRQLTAVLQYLVQHHLTHHALPEAIAAANRWVQHDPLDETACRSLMQAYALAGDRSAALRAFRSCKAALAAELDLAPDPITTRLAVTIRLGPTSSPQPARQPAPLVRTQVSLPLVGRADDYAGLVAAYTAAAVGTLQTVVVAGEAGIGKTRLVSEFLQWAALQGADILRGRAFEAGGQLPYQPVVLALRQRLERENAPEDLLADVWLAELARLLPELAERYPDLGQAMGSVGGSVGGNEGLAAARTFESVARLGMALSRRQPLVFFLDDWQWADAGSIDLLQYLSQAWAVNKVPILLVLTIRSEDLSSNPDLTHWLANLERVVSVKQLLLHRLTQADVQACVGAWASRESNSADTISAVSERLYRETVGIPFFMMETVKLLVDDLGLAGEAGRIDLAAVLDETEAGMAMPHTVRQAILARLDKFDQIARSLAAAAAILGRDCRYQELCEIAGVDELAGLAALDALLARQLFVETHDPHRPYNFAHDKIRDVVYTEAGHSRRRIFHHRTFFALERASLPPAELAYHAELAGLSDEARRHLWRAAHDAGQVFQNRLAVGYLTRALALTAPSDQVDRCALLLARQDIYHLLGDRDAQAIDLEELARLVITLPDVSTRAEVALRRARYAEATSDYAASVTAAAEAAQLAEQAGDLGLVALSTLAWGNSLWRQRQFSAAQHRLQQAVTQARVAALPQVEADSLRALGMVAEFQRDYAEAKNCYEQSLAICRETDNRPGEVSTLNNLGVVACYLGHLSQARVYFEQALDLRRRLGDRRGEGHALYNIGFLTMMEGDYARAQILSEQALAVFRETSDRWGEADACHSLGAVAAATPDFDRALGYYQQAMAICQAIGHRRSEVLVLRSLGHLFADHSQLQAAAWHYGQALPLARELDLPGYVLECQAGLAEVAVAEEDLNRALTVINEALDSVNDEALVQANEPFRFYLSCFRVLRACGDQRANNLLATACRSLQEQAARMPDEVGREAFRQNVPSHRELLRQC